MAAEPRLNLYQDALDHLADFLGGSALDAEQRIVRKAVQLAYTRFTNERSWQYLYTHGRINLVDSYSEGTCTFDFTGGSSERLVTFSQALSTTVQGWAKFGRLLIENSDGAEIVYDIDDYKSTTTVTLTETHNPGGDLAAGTDFTLYRSTYPLPADFRRLSEPVPEWQWNAWYIPPQEWMFLERHEHAEGSPMAWCVPIDHEILTAQGWKTPDQLVVGELVMAYNNDTQEMAWQPLLDFNIFDFEGELFSLDRYGRRFLFTEDHRWPVLTRKGVRKFVRARDLTGADLLPIAGDYRQENSTLTPRLAAILGWIITDGSGLWSKMHWNTAIYQSVKNEPKLRDIEQLCGKPRRRKGAGDDRSVQVSKEDRRALRKAIPTRNDLFRVVSGLSREAAEAMLDAMMKADGYVSQRGQRVFSQAEHNCDYIDVFQLLALMTGQNAGINTDDRSKWDCFAARAKHGRTLRHSCTLNREKHHYLDEGFEREPFAGKVWCPRTEWGTWVMRHDGHAIITGNSILPDPDKNGGYAIIVYPYPDENETLDFIYQRYARTMKYTGYESAARTGTITVSAASTAVTGSGTSWTTDMQGSYMRFITGTTVPDGLGGLNPFSEQRKIRTVTNTTAIVLDTAVDNAYTAKAFCVSDPVDVPEPMWEAFCRCCEWQLALTGRIKDVDQKYGYYQAALRRAFELDAVMEIPRMFGADTVGSVVTK